MARVEVKLKLNDNTFYTIDRFNGLKSVESQSQSNPDAKTINYGVIPNTGSFEVVDINGEIAQKIKDGSLTNSNIETRVFVNDNQVQNHISNDSDYVVNDKTFTSNFTNELSKWETLQYGGFTYPLTSASAYTILADVLESIDYTASDIDDMLSETMVVDDSGTESTIKDYLEGIIIQYPYLYADNIRNTVNKICTIAQLDVFEDDDGIVRFISARPKVVSSKPIIVIPKKNQLSEFRKDFILKNKYDGIEMEQTIIKENKLSNSECGVATTATSGYDSQTNVVTATVQDSEYSITTNYRYYYKSLTVTIPARTNANLNFTDAVTNFSTTESKNNVNYGDIKVYSVYSTLMQKTVTSDPTSLDPSAQAILFKDKVVTDVYNPETNTRTVTMDVCVGRDMLVYIENNTTPSQNETFTNNVVADTVNFTLYGIQTKIDFTKDSASTSGIGSAETIVQIANSEILQDTSTVTATGENIPTTIKNNILADYSEGVATADITVICADYYDSEGNQVLDWDYGELIQIGDIVRVDTDNAGHSASKDLAGKDICYRVVGRTFRYSGYPYMDLVLQEVTPHQASTEPIILNYTAIDDNGIYEGQQSFNGNIVGYAIGKPTITISGGTETLTYKVCNGCNEQVYGEDVNRTIEEYKPTQIIPSYLYIPDTYNNLPVVEILPSAFDGGSEATGIGQDRDSYTQCCWIDRIRIGNNLTTIGGNAFSCIGLDTYIHTLNLPSSVTYCGSMFADENNIIVNSNITTPGNGNGIYDGARSVIFKNTVTRVSGYILYNNIYRIPTLVFEHSQDQNITIDINSLKNATAVTIYTDNTIVANYNWASKNITANIKPLSEYGG